MAPSSASGGSSASAVRRVLGSGLGWGSAVVGGEGTIGRHSWTAPARYEGVGVESCRVVDCLAADALELLVTSPGNSDSKVLRKKFETADGFCPAEEFVKGDQGWVEAVYIPEGLLLYCGDRDAEASYCE